MRNLPVIALWVCLSCVFAHAQTLDMNAEPLVHAELVSEDPQIAPGRPFWLGLDLKMAPGWHVNWINPGDAGLAPSVSWTLPEGFSAEEIRWPYPERFELPELSIFGYEDRVLLLTRITPPAEMGEADEFTLGARVDWLACRESCIPGGQELTITLPVRGTTGLSQSQNAAFKAAFAALPVTTTTWLFEASLDGNQIVLDVVPPDRFDARLGRVLFYPTQQGVIANSTEQILAATKGGYRLTVELDGMNVEKPERVQGVLVSESGWWPYPGKALEIDVVIEEKTYETR